MVHDEAMAVATSFEVGGRRDEGEQHGVDNETQFRLWLLLSSSGVMTMSGNSLSTI